MKLVKNKTVKVLNDDLYNLINSLSEFKTVTFLSYDGQIIMYASAFEVVTVNCDISFNFSMNKRNLSKLKAFADNLMSGEYSDILIEKNVLTINDEEFVIKK